MNVYCTAVNRNALPNRLIKSNWRASSVARSMGRAGYTLLELMLALALLGALMTVAWSIMGTYRDAESRGWKLSQRTQIIRTAREWLQGDMLQLATPDNPSDSNSNFDSNLDSDSNRTTASTPSTPALTAQNLPRFVGDATGFSATLAPPLDPLPFFERLMSDALAGDASVSGLSVSQTRLQAEDNSDANQPTDQRGQEPVQASPWPAERLVIEYRLIPVANPARSTPATRNQVTRNAAAANSLSSGDLSEIQFMLVRRERLDNRDSANDLSPFATDNPLGSNPAADRLLTAQDLYRQTDESQMIGGVILRESKLNGITQAGFKYCDGVGWSDQWDSGARGTLPSAIALSFDFPAAADMRPIEPPPVDRSSEDFANDESGGFAGEYTGLSFADSALASASVAEVSTANELGLVQGSVSQVQVVVHINARWVDRSSMSRDAESGGPP